MAGENPTDGIPQLTGYDEASLDQQFAALGDQVRREAAALRTHEAREAFHLRWFGRKQGRLKLVSDAWLKTAPADARRALGIRFNELKQQIEAALADAAAAPVAGDSAKMGIDISM